MAIAVNFYTFNKKANSTKIPTTVNATYNCNLIEPCSIINPVIAIIGTDNTFNPSAYNYVRIATFNRYYFVNDWIYDSGKWIAKCNVDVLASWRSSIASQEQYYSRCSRAWDGNIEDTLYPETTETDIKYTTSNETLENITTRGGTFLVQILGHHRDSDLFKGPSSYYLMSSTVFENFAQALFSNDVYWEIVGGLLKLNQYLLSVQWIGIPFTEQDYSQIGRSTRTIYLGNVPITLSATVTENIWQLDNKYERPVLQYNFTFSNLPKHSKSVVYGSYMNSAPWSVYELVYLPVGKIQFDGKYISNTNTMVLVVQIDCMGGDGIYTLYRNSINKTNEILTGSFNPWVNFSTSSNSVNAESLGKAILNGAKTVAAFAVTKNPTFLANLPTIAKGLETVGNLSNVTNPTYGQTSSQCSVICSTQTPYIKATFIESVPHDRNNHGSPCCKILILSNVGTETFAIAQDPHYEINCTEKELDDVYNITSGGFYYE